MKDRGHFADCIGCSDFNSKSFVVGRFLDNGPSDP